MTPKQEWLGKLAQAIVDGDAEAAERLTKEALAAGVDSVDIVQGGGAAGLTELGDRFQRGEAYLPELMLGAEAMKGALSVVFSIISPEQQSALQQGRVVLGTVFGDVHDIGKSMVSTMLSVNGFVVQDLGINVSSIKFIKAAEESRANIIGLSSLLSTSAYYMEEMINLLEDAGVRDRYFVLVGGSPITSDFARRIRADGWAKTATGAVKVCKQLLQPGMKPGLPEPIMAEY